MRSVVLTCLISVTIGAPNGGYNYVTPNYNYVGSSPTVPQHVHHHHIVQHQQQHQQTHSFDGLNSAPVQQYLTNHAIQSSYNSGFNNAPNYNQYNHQSNNIVRQHSHQRAVPLVTKHIYIHSAPEEPDEEIYEDNSIQQQRKHYNIVFIKAPSASTRKTAVSLANALNEEKTIIYVLTKKNDVSEIRQALQSVPHQPQKPEVFFIKYRTPEEAQHAQQTIQAQYDTLGGSTKVSDEGYAPVSSVVGALNDGTYNNGFIGQPIYSGSGISSISGSSFNGISSGSGNLIIGGSAAYLPPNKIKK